MTPEDPRVEQPEGKKTVEVATVSDRALLEKLLASSVDVAAKVNSLTGNVHTLMGESTSLHARMGLMEGRVAKLETPSIIPAPPLTSTGIKALINQHPSQMDLELQAAQAAQIVKDIERDRRIEETHQLAAKAAEVLAAQSDYMGMGKRGAQWLFSEKGRTAMAQAAAGLVAAYEVLKHGGVLK